MGEKKVGVYGVLSCRKNVEGAGQPTIPGQVYRHPGFTVVELKQNIEPEARCCWLLNCGNLSQTSLPGFPVALV